jgi:hypothetical protein
MKINKLIVTIMIAVAPFITYAQSQFDKFEDIDGVTSIVVTQKAFSLMSTIGAESDDEYMNLIKNITSLRVFVTEKSSVAVQMKTEADSYLKKAKLEELMRINDDENNVKIYIKEGSSENYVKELFMFVQGTNINENDSSETVIISLLGNIDLKQIAKLTEKMNLPGGEHLKKAQK